MIFSGTLLRKVPPSNFYFLVMLLYRSIKTINNSKSNGYLLIDTLITITRNNYINFIKVKTNCIYEAYSVEE